MKTRSFIIIFGVLFALSLCLALLLPHMGHGTVANIYRGDECIYSVDLSRVEKSELLTFDDGNGHVNHVEIAPGRIRVADANCPDRVCVNAGWIEGGGLPIVCMPAKLVIRIEGSAPKGFDAIAGGAG